MSTETNLNTVDPVDPVDPVDITELTDEIKAMAARHRIAIVAIAGPPGSGKSTFAAALAKRIGPSCCTIPMDGFHLDNTTLIARGLLSVKGAPETFDREGFDQLIDGLKDGSAQHFPTFDRDLDSVLQDGGSVPAGVSLLLFEGNYLLFDEPGWADIAQKWDASIWLEVPEDVLTQRLVRRWLDQGMSEADATERAQMNDLANARRVKKKALPATWVKNN